MCYFLDAGNLCQQWFADNNYSQSEGINGFWFREAFSVEIAVINNPWAGISPVIPFTVETSEPESRRRCASLYKTLVTFTGETRVVSRRWRRLFKVNYRSLKIHTNLPLMAPQH